MRTVCTVVKSKGKISQNFVAFSEYIIFNEEFFLLLTEDIFQRVKEQNQFIHNNFLLTIHKVSANFLKIAIEFLLGTPTYIEAIASESSEEDLTASLNNFAFPDNLFFSFFPTIFNSIYRSRASKSQAYSA